MLEDELYMSKLKHSIDNLLDINKELEWNNQLLQEEINQMVVSSPAERDDRDLLIDLVEEDILWKEANASRPSERILKIIEVYRSIRPKEETHANNPRNTRSPK
jgi:hypothetical protein